MSRTVDAATVALRKRNFTYGLAVRCLACHDPSGPSLAGARGTVLWVDDTGTVFVRWDDGRVLGMLVDVDVIELLR